MSHTVVQSTKCLDENIIRLTAQRVGASFLGRGKHKLYAEEVEGVGIKFPGWSYPVVFDSTGAASYDTYNGRWGNVEDLNKFKQLYPIEAGRYVYAGQATFVETQLPNGDIQLEVQLGHGTATGDSSGSQVGPGGVYLG